MRRRGAATLIAATSSIAVTACNDAPMSYLHTFGPAADPVTSLAWGLGGICSLVVVVISVLLVGGIARDRSRALHSSAAAIDRPASGVSWIYIGVSLSTLILLGIVVWTLLVLKAVAQPPGAPTVTIEIRAHQWWWEARYLGDVPSATFVTANELHIPVGEPVRLRLIGDDVIHSFWIPALAGKTDVLPGQVNEAWLQADVPGVYRGQCAEFCGAQHAHMSAIVEADSKPAFDAWRQRQLSPAARVEAPPQSAGEQAFETRCSVCHTVRGTAAGGIVGPDLTHLMSRRTLGAGAVPNTREFLPLWIADAQAFKPGSRMPALSLRPDELAAISAYVQTLH